MTKPGIGNCGSSLRGMLVNVFTPSAASSAKTTRVNCGFLTASSAIFMASLPRRSRGGRGRGRRAGLGGGRGVALHLDGRAVVEPRGARVDDARDAVEARLHEHGAVGAERVDDDGAALDVRAVGRERVDAGEL